MQKMMEYQSELGRSENIKNLNAERKMFIHLTILLQIYLLMEDKYKKVLEEFEKFVKDNKGRENPNQHYTYQLQRKRAERNLCCARNDYQKNLLEVKKNKEYLWYIDFLQAGLDSRPTVKAIWNQSLIRQNRFIRERFHYTQLWRRRQEHVSKMRKLNESESLSDEACNIQKNPNIQDIKHMNTEMEDLVLRMRPLSLDKERPDDFETENNDFLCRDTSLNYELHMCRVQNNMMQWISKLRERHNQACITNEWRTALTSLDRINELELLIDNVLYNLKTFETYEFLRMQGLRYIEQRKKLFTDREPKLMNLRLSCEEAKKLCKVWSEEDENMCSQFQARRNILIDNLKKETEKKYKEASGFNHT